MRNDHDNWEMDHAPREVAKRNRWKILRAESGKVHRLVVVSTKHVNLMLHFYGRRSMPCLREGCVPCSVFRERRWTGFFLAYETGSNERRLVQFTEGAAQSVIDAEQRLGSIRGCCVELARPGKNKQGPVVVKFSDQRIEDWGLPKEEDITQILCAMFDIRLPSVEQAAIDRAAAAAVEAEEIRLTLQAEKHLELDFIRDRTKPLPGQQGFPFVSNGH